MEKQPNLSLLSEKEELILAVFSEKKGREVHALNPYTCYVNIGSPTPDLAVLTASMLEELERKPFEAKVWASRWDKSIISVSAGGKPGCSLLRDDDLRGKSFVAVSTTKLVNSAELLCQMPTGELGFIGINDRPTTVDGFLISYFHMVNELIWDLALEQSSGEYVDLNGYGKALQLVIEKGFSVGLVSEEEIIELKKLDPKTTIRIYGSKKSKFVPEILGAIIKT